MLGNKYDRLLSLEKEAFITGLAEDIVNDYFPGNTPIKPSLIAEDYNISWSVGNYEDAFDGLLEHHNGSFHIYINADRQQNQNRQRFTFCHELGHFFIDGHRNALVNGEVPYHSSFTGFSSEYVVEREADFFSACLLLPATRMLKEYRKYRFFQFRIIEELSQTYGVSRLATLFRLFYLDVHPMMIVHGKKGVIQNIFTSKDFFYYPKYGRAKLPEHSLIYEYFKNGTKYHRTEQLWTGDWFKCENEKKIYERCLYYDQYDSCYSIIWRH